MNFSLEVKSQLLTDALKNYRFIMHGNSSAKDVDMIRKEGLRFVEGRATFTANLIHALDWAKSHERRVAYSMGKTNKAKEEEGAVFVFSIPEDYTLAFATFTDIQVDEKNKIISGDSLKYISGFKQLGMYEGEVEERKEYLESIKLEQRPNLHILPEAIAQEILPDGSLDNKLEEIATAAKGPYPFPSIKYHDELQTGLMEMTYQSIVVLRIRTLSIELKALQGYKVLNKNEDALVSPQINLSTALPRLNNYVAKINEPNFTLGFDWLDEYVRENIRHLQTL